MKINKYPDGSSYVVLDKERKIEPIEHRINSYEDLWHLNQIVEVWNHRYGRLDIKPMVIIPNLLDAQADRRFDDNHSSGLKLVCKFLNGMDARFKIFHPHNAEVVEALIDDVEIIDNSEFIDQVLNEVSEYKPNWTFEDNLILMSSDAGGYKPLIKLANQIKWEGEVFSASKARQDGKMYQYIDPLKDFGGKDILIIDDISVYGGTFKGLAGILRARNCGKLYLAVSHMTVQKLGEDPVTNYFDRVFTTNSKYNSYESVVDLHFIKQPKNLEIIKLFNN